MLVSRRICHKWNHRARVTRSHGKKKKKKKRKRNQRNPKELVLHSSGKDVQPLLSAHFSQSKEMKEAKVIKEGKAEQFFSSSSTFSSSCEPRCVVPWTRSWPHVVSSRLSQGSLSFLFLFSFFSHSLSFLSVTPLASKLALQLRRRTVALIPPQTAFILETSWASWHCFISKLQDTHPSHLSVLFFFFLLLLSF